MTDSHSQKEMKTFFVLKSDGGLIYLAVHTIIAWVDKMPSSLQQHVNYTIFIICTFIIPKIWYLAGNTTVWYHAQWVRSLEGSASGHAADCQTAVRQHA